MHNDKGFTLVEVLVVLVFCTVLAVIGAMVYFGIGAVTAISNDPSIKLQTTECAKNDAGQDVCKTSTSRLGF
jgi:Tfp pilus assembly protein PilX